VCGRGPVVTSITSTTGRLSFYQTAGHSTGLRNVAHRGVTTTRLATHNSRMRGSRLRADVLRVIPTGEIVARQLDVPAAGRRRHLSDRALARPPGVRSTDAYVHADISQYQGESPRTHEICVGTPRALPPAGQGPGIPREPVTMPSHAPPTTCQHKAAVRAPRHGRGVGVGPAMRCPHRLTTSACCLWPRTLPKGSTASSTPPTRNDPSRSARTCTPPRSTSSCPRRSPPRPWTGCCTTPTSARPPATACSAAG
jgi:hypothetical protein